MPFICSICGEESTRICVRCTKDACDNHLCEKCRRCSDCCECEVALAPHPPESVRDVLHAAAAAQSETVVEAIPEAPVVEAPAVDAPVVETPAELPPGPPAAESTAGPEESGAREPESPGPEPTAL